MVMTGRKRDEKVEVLTGNGTQSCDPCRHRGPSVSLGPLGYHGQHPLPSARSLDHVSNISAAKYFDKPLRYSYPSHNFSLPARVIQEI